MDTSVTRRNGGAVMRHRAAGATDGGARLPLSSPPSADSGNHDGNGHKVHRKSRLADKSRYVLIGALSVLALCLAGMMLSSSSSGPSVNIRVDSPLPNERHRRQKTTRRDVSRARGSGTKAERNDGNGGRGALKPYAKVTKHAIQSEPQSDEQTASKVQTQHHGRAQEQRDTINETIEDQQNPIERKANDDEYYASSRSEDERETWRERHARKKERERKMGLARDLGVDFQQTLQVPVKSRTGPSIHVDMSLFGYEARPRHVQIEFEQVSGVGLKPSIDKDAARDETDDEQRSDRSDEDDRETGSWNHIRVTNVAKLDVHGRGDAARSDREINPYPDSADYFKRLETIDVADKKYAKSAAEPIETEECKPKHDWQTQAFPTCNVMHEYSLSSLSHMMGRSLRNKLNTVEGDGDEKTRILGHGYWRDVWVLSKVSTAFSPKPTGQEELTVLKTLRYKHQFTDRNYDRHRKDSLASERLSKSPNVIDIYAYCSNSAVFEYGSGGDIEAVIWPYDAKEKAHYVEGLTSHQQLDLAYQVARGIADIHDVEEDGFASIADITPSQFILVDGRYKVNDFNRCRFMRQYKEDDSPCGFYVGANPGKFRSPEEYNYREEDEMIDVYSMGNIFYVILTGDMPFEGQKESKAQKKVTQGIRPKVPDEVKEQALEDPAVEAIKTAMHQCWKHKPDERPRASAIRDQLKEALDRSKKEEEQQQKQSKALDEGSSAEDSKR